MSSAALAFDRLASIYRLTSGGIDEQHARAHAAALETALGESVATKSDIAGLRGDIEAQGRDLRAEIEAQGRDLRVEIEALGRDLRAEITDVRREMRELETRLEAKIETALAGLKVEILRWLLATQIALGGFVFAVVKLAH